MSNIIRDNFDIVVVGGGHAGAEAALSSARLGLKTSLFVLNIDAIANMPCNPNIGGTSKGHLVKEIDALGGEMAKNIDKTFIQSRMLNTAKGPAVFSSRAQADKEKYSSQMRKTLFAQDNLTISQLEIVEILVDCGKVFGVVTESGKKIFAKAVILCLGTYLNARCLFGDVIVESGPNGFRNSIKLLNDLTSKNVPLQRFKTGTPARIKGNTIDKSKMQEQFGDDIVVPFSFETDKQSVQRPQVFCYLTYTNEKTHEIIKGGLNRSPLFSGIIEGTGTRYCPSIEDKVVRFSDKDRHQVFIEPETEDGSEMYVAGMSTSLPEDVQEAMYRSVPGLENCEITRVGYAIEYDCLDATCLNLSLEFKEISGLFSAGQFNGSSGYEEAAAQGLIAGINAAMKIFGRAPLILSRSDGYIGVLIDDLVTKGTKEPYRMMTSRAEYRLLLRQDNADLRLTKMGHEVGLISDIRFKKLLKKEDEIFKEIKRISHLNIAPCSQVNELLRLNESSEITTGMRLTDLIKRPELSYSKTRSIDLDRPELDDETAEQVNIQVKYDGYIKRQNDQVEQFKKLENRLMPSDIDYAKIKGIRDEARQKLSKIRPLNIGQASRITGVSPADVSILLVYIKK